MVAVAAKRATAGHVLRRARLLVASKRDPDLTAGGRGVVTVDARDAAWARHGKGKVRRCAVTRCAITRWAITRWAESESAQCDGGGGAGRDQRVGEHPEKVAHGRCEGVELDRICANLARGWLGVMLRRQSHGRAGVACFGRWGGATWEFVGGEWCQWHAPFPMTADESPYSSNMPLTLRTSWLPPACPRPRWWPNSCAPMLARAARPARW